MTRSFTLAAILLASPPVFAVDAELFPVPTELEGRVWFWEQMFGVYESTHIALHDREHPCLLWQIVALPSHPNKEREKELRQATSQRALTALRARLRRLERKPRATDSLDEQLLEVAKKRPNALRGADGRLRMQTGVADRFRAGIERSKPHMKNIRAALDAEGVPRELGALPFIESMFKPTIRSHAGAAGLWQLMPATARGLGLKVSSEVDERLNVSRATGAAARMLKDNYRMLKSWPLAITGYNHGPYGVKRATQELGTRSLPELIKRYKKSTWGFASKNFYAEFVAAARTYERATSEPPDEIAQKEPE